MTRNTTTRWRCRNSCSDTCAPKLRSVNWPPRKVLGCKTRRCTAFLRTERRSRIFHGGHTMPSLKSNRVLQHPGETKSDERQFKSKVNVPENNRRALIDLLNARLVDTIDMQTQAKFAHWNVKGEDFYQLHLLFDSIAEHVEDAVDLIAERVTALGGRANGTARQVAANSSIEEYDLNIVAGMDHVRTLLDRLAAVANASRGAISESDELEDRATSDLFTEVVRTADKDLYFLESHLHS